MPTRLEIVNRSLTEIAKGNPLLNLTDTIAGRNADTLYDGAVLMLLRQQDWEFSRADVALAVTGNTPPAEFAFEYGYPSDCQRVRQVRPATWDPFDPQPVTWDVGTTLVTAVQTTVIWTNQADARLVYTTSAVTENDWDSVFAEQMVRYLGSQLALPVAGRPDFSREMLKIAGGIGNAGMDRDS